MSNASVEVICQMSTEWEIRGIMRKERQRYSDTGKARGGMKGDEETEKVEKQGERQDPPPGRTKNCFITVF